MGSEDGPCQERASKFSLNDVSSKRIMLSCTILLRHSYFAMIQLA